MCEGSSLTAKLEDKDVACRTAAAHFTQFMHLSFQARSLDWWPRFFPKVIECISSKHCPMVQAAAYAVQQAAKVQSSNAAVRKSFEVYMPIILERILSRIETLKHKKGKAHQVRLL